MSKRHLGLRFEGGVQRREEYREEGEQVKEGRDGQRVAPPPMSICPHVGCSWAGMLETKGRRLGRTSRAVAVPSTWPGLSCRNGELLMVWKAVQTLWDPERLLWS